MVMQVVDKVPRTFETSDYEQRISGVKPSVDVL